MDILQGNGDDVPLAQVGDGLNGRCFATSWLLVEQETEHVGDATLHVPGRVVQEELWRRGKVVEVRLVGKIVKVLSGKYLVLLY